MTPPSASAKSTPPVVTTTTSRAATRTAPGAEANPPSPKPEQTKEKSPPASPSRFLKNFEVLEEEHYIEEVLDWQNNASDNKAKVRWADGDVTWEPALHILQEYPQLWVEFENRRAARAQTKAEGEACANPTTDAPPAKKPKHKQVRFDLK